MGTNPAVPEIRDEQRMTLCCPFTPAETTRVICLSQFLDLGVVLSVLSRDFSLELRKKQQVEQFSRDCKKSIFLPTIFSAFKHPGALRCCKRDGFLFASDAPCVLRFNYHGHSGLHAPSAGYVCVMVSGTGNGRSGHWRRHRKWRPGKTVGIRYTRKPIGRVDVAGGRVAFPCRRPSEVVWDEQMSAARADVAVLKPCSAARVQSNRRDSYFT